MLACLMYFLMTVNILLSPYKILYIKINDKTKFKSQILMQNI